MKVLYGTRNQAKLAVMRRYLNGLDLEILGLDDMKGPLPEVEETGKDPLENAEMKARAYYQAFQMPVFSCDSGLYFENLPDHLQPGIFVRRVGGKRLTDEEMVAYYGGLAEKYGDLVGRYRNAVCLITGDGQVYKSMEDDLSGESFLLTSVPHRKRVPGFPLDSLTVDRESRRYYYDLDEKTADDVALDEGFQRFFKAHLLHPKKQEVLAFSSLPREWEEKARDCIAACKEWDGTFEDLFLGNDYNRYQDMKSFFLSVSDGVVDGILGVYADQETVGEISAYVRPEKRRRGIFRSLYQEALEELKKFGYQGLLFQTEKVFREKHDLTAALGVKLSSREYLMIYDPKRAKQTKQEKELIEVRPAIEEDLDVLAKIQAQAFHDSLSMAGRYVQQAYQDPDTWLLTAKMGGEVCGCCCAEASGQRAVVFGLCVKQAFRGRGAGRRLLSETICQVRKSVEKEISLSVDFENPGAMVLYENCGFRPVTVLEFYRKEIKK